VRIKTAFSDSGNHRTRFNAIRGRHLRRASGIENGKRLVRKKGRGVPPFPGRRYDFASSNPGIRRSRHERKKGKSRFRTCMRPKEETDTEIKNKRRRAECGGRGRVFSRGKNISGGEKVDHVTQISYKIKGPTLMGFLSEAVSSSEGNQSLLLGEKGFPEGEISIKNRAYGGLRGLLHLSIESSPKKGKEHLRKRV